MNFMKSGLDLVKSEGIRLWLKVLKVASAVGAACFTGYAIFLVVKEKKQDINVLNCKSKEFLIQDGFLAVVVLIFFFFTVRTHILIGRQYEETKDDFQFVRINEHRRQAMDNVWVLIVWLTVTTIESVTYSAVVFALADPECIAKDTHWWNLYF